jgi:hypothetical protein
MRFMGWDRSRGLARKMGRPDGMDGSLPRGTCTVNPTWQALSLPLVGSMCVEANKVVPDQLSGPSSCWHSLRIAAHRVLFWHKLPSPFVGALGVAIGDARKHLT